MILNAGLPSISSLYETWGNASALRRRDQYSLSRLRHQILRPHGEVSVADAPEALRILVILEGYEIKPISLVYLVSYAGLGLGDDANLLVANRPSFLISYMVILNIGITAFSEEQNFASLKREKAPGQVLSAAGQIEPG
jgi:hypothetical protein